jgi:hypothetical protein
MRNFLQIFLTVMLIYSQVRLSLTKDWFMLLQSLENYSDTLSEYNKS